MSPNRLRFQPPKPCQAIDRKSVVLGKRGDLGGRRIIKKKKKYYSWVSHVINIRNRHHIPLGTFVEFKGFSVSLAWPLTLLVCVRITYPAEFSSCKRSMT